MRDFGIHWKNKRDEVEIRAITHDPTVLEELKRMSNHNSKDLEGMKRYGINVENALVISIPKLRALAKRIGRDHEMALKLWDSGIREARILACLIDDPEAVTEAQMERWANTFESWDVCDQCCSNLFDKTRFSYSKALEWSGSKKEFVKRAGFVIMASLAVHDKGDTNSKFLTFLKVVEGASPDDRNLVKKAVNWAIRQIGKRNKTLNNAAIATAERMKNSDSKATRWIASDALRELNSPKVQGRLSSP